LAMSVRVADWIEWDLHPAGRDVQLFQLIEVLERRRHRVERVPTL
jgi:hypothetical protein